MARSSTANRVTIDSRRVEKVYSVLARVYDDVFDWALGPGRRVAIARLPIKPGDRILEVGVGTGLSLPFYPAGSHVTGIDISEPMLEQARGRAESLSRGDFDLRVMDAHRLTFGDETFDHVVAPYVISVVPDPGRVMLEIRRVCKPGGTVVVVNHFHGSNPVRRFAEKLLSPASQWLGFRMDVQSSVVTATPGLDTVQTEYVNALGLWQLLVLRRLAT